MIYKTDRLILTPLHKGLLNTDEYYQWMNDPEVCRYNSHGNFPVSEEKKIEFFRSTESGKILVWSISIRTTESTGELHNDGLSKKTRFIEKYLGNVSLQYINWINRSAELAIMIGEKNYWGKGLGTEACQLVLDHGFNRLNLHRIWLGTALDNQGMIKIALNIGMTQEGVLRESLFLNGRYINELKFGILKEEWQERKVKKC